MIRLSQCSRYSLALAGKRTKSTKNPANISVAWRGALENKAVFPGIFLYARKALSVFFTTALATSVVGLQVYKIANKYIIGMEFVCSSLIGLMCNEKKTNFSPKF